jgi:hypothetical protein
MQRLKISQNPETGAIETRHETAPETIPQTETDPQRNPESLQLAAARPGLERGDDSRDRTPAVDQRLPVPAQELALGLGRSRASQEAEQTLKNHNLHGSFVSHFGLLMQRQDTKIRIGLIDDFSPGKTHGVNVEQRILGTVSESIRHRVEIVRYDVGGKNPEQIAKVIAQAGRDAQEKKMVALSVSGGINAYPVANIEKLIGNNDLTKENARQAYDALVKNNGTSPAMQDAYKQLNLASGKIPVVTPVWNNDTTTMAALLLGSKSGNGMITSIDKPAINPGGPLPSLYNATEIPGLVDVRVPGAFPNPNTSQSTPYFIGNMINYALEKHPAVPNPQPGPKPTPRAAAETPPAG